jgi:hypothetical protein
MGIPTATVVEIVDPLVDAVNKDKGLRGELDVAFSEWLLLPGEQRQDPSILLAITPHPPADDDFAAAENLFLRRFWPSLSEELRALFDDDRSRVIALDELTVPVWISAWKLDLDFLTYGGKGVADSPEPRA